MKQITVTLNVDEDIVMAESGLDNLEEAIRRELGWLLDSGMSVESWSFSDQEKYPSKVHCLSEEFEGADGIREFEIIALSENKDFLRKLMRAKILADEYGFAADKGISSFEKDFFSTNFDNGFVEYAINEIDILADKDLQILIQENVSSINKASVSNIINAYIDELEDQEVMHAEIVSILMDDFSREELEDLGFGEFIEDCLMTEADREEAKANAKSSLDLQIAKAQAVKVPVKPAGTYQKDSHAQERG